MWANNKNRKSTESFFKNNSFKYGGCILFDVDTNGAELIDFIKRHFKVDNKKAGTKNKTEIINKIIIENQIDTPTLMARKIKVALKIEKDVSKYDTNYVEKKLSELRKNILND